MHDSKSHVERPLSPHLQVYRVSMTMAMSIVHRMTGAGLYVGTILLVWWLLAANSVRSFDMVNALFGSWIGLLLLLGYSWALIHHALGGVRHLIWDTGRGLGSPERDYLATATIAGSVALTLVVWILGYMLKG
jgi:succinate dehydrogenase / fumarate reductase cytochrome b subunit